MCSAWNGKSSGTLPFFGSGLKAPFFKVALFLRRGSKAHLGFLLWFVLRMCRHRSLALAYPYYFFPNAL